MTIQSVHRALKVLSLFSLSHVRLGISDISRSLGLHKATVQGLVRTLAEEGFLEQDSETKKYKLGLKIYELGVILAGSLEINQRAADSAHRLASYLEKLVRVAILRGDEAIIILDAYPRSQPFLFRQFGPTFPLYCTAMGKAILAYFGEEELDRYFGEAELIEYTANTITNEGDLRKELKITRGRGYSINKEEHLMGRASIGAPIFDRQGRVSASICLVGSPGAILGNKMKTVCNEVLNSSYEISRSMGYSPERRTR